MTENLAFESSSQLSATSKLMVKEEQVESLVRQVEDFHMEMEFSVMKVASSIKTGNRGAGGSSGSKQRDSPRSTCLQNAKIGSSRSI